MFAALFSQITSRIRGAISAVIKKATIVTIAVVVFLFALSFGLVAAYHALVDISGFTPLVAAGVVAGSLVALALLVLAMLPLVGAKPKKDAIDVVTAPGDTLVSIDRNLGMAARKVGALPLVATAFAVGFLASRR